MRVHLGNTSAVAHAWAHQTQSEGRASSVRFEGRSFYSYSTVIAWVGPNKDGETVYLVDDHTYNVTTTRHQSEVRSAIPHGAREHTIRTNNLAYSANVTPERAAGMLLSSIQTQDAYFGSKRRGYIEVLGLRTAKRYVPDVLAWVDRLVAFGLDFGEEAEMVRLLDEAFRREKMLDNRPPVARDTLQLTIGAIISYLVNVPFLVDEADLRRLRADADAAAAEAERKRIEQARIEKERQEALLAEYRTIFPDAIGSWRAGANAYTMDPQHRVAFQYLVAHTPGDRLRPAPRNPIEITETNRSASVPTIDIVRVADTIIKVCEAAAQRGRGTVAVKGIKLGYFGVSNVDENGTLTVGCHRFSLEEMVAYRHHLQTTPYTLGEATRTLWEWNMLAIEAQDKRKEGVDG